MYVCSYYIILTKFLKFARLGISVNRRSTATVSPLAASDSSRSPCMNITNMRIRIKNKKENIEYSVIDYERGRTMRKIVRPDQVEDSWQPEQPSLLLVPVSINNTYMHTYIHTYY